MSQTDLRAEGYELLSECYKEPSWSFAADVAWGRLEAELRRVFGALEIPLGADLTVAGPVDAVLDRLSREYHALFSVPSLEHYVLPVESAFKNWSAGSPLLDVPVTGLVMGPPAVDMLRRYAARGLSRPRAFKDWPDHLTLLLEYGAWLLRTQDLAEWSDFVHAHLDGWVEALRDEVWAKSHSPFYRAVTAATVAFVEAERALAGDARIQTP